MIRRCHFYYTLTDSGLQYLREFLHLPNDIVPNTMSGEKKQKPEELLAKIRKIEENKYCVNCGEYAKLGHTNVCGNPCSC